MFGSWTTGFHIWAMSWVPDVPTELSLLNDGRSAQIPKIHTVAKCQCSLPEIVSGLADIT